MKTWKRFGYESKDGTLYIGSEDDLLNCEDHQKLRIMSETDFIKLETESRMYKRVFSAAMNWHRDKFNPKYIAKLHDACETASLKKK